MSPRNPAVIKEELRVSEEDVSRLKEELKEAEEQIKSPAHGALFYNQHGAVFVSDRKVHGYEGEPRLWRLSMNDGPNWPTHASVASWATTYGFEFTPVPFLGDAPFVVGG